MLHEEIERPHVQVDIIACELIVDNPNNLTLVFEKLKINVKIFESRQL
jgi:hypothetical protein